MQRKGSQVVHKETKFSEVASVGNRYEQLLIAAQTQTFRNIPASLKIIDSIEMVYCGDHDDIYHFDFIFIRINNS